jgi:tetratricopeptide (TPR) repeat protein
VNRIALVGNARSSAPATAADDDGYRYWAFLSYSHADSKQADRLHSWLERFHTPQGLVGNPHPLGLIPARLTPIFRDRHELAAGSSLGREIDEALTSSRYLIVLCSPAAARSRWVDQEIRAFKTIHGEERILAAIVGGEPFSGGDDECFPEALRHRVGKDGRLTKQKVEPIAADLRDDRDGWRTGALKVAAGLLDVGLDDLIQRDQLRRQRRMTWIAAASILGMAFTTGLSVVAINARDAARDERRQAEGLVGFMLGDLRGELEPIGRLDALDKVGERALAYYEKQDQADLGDEQLSQRSKALAMLAEIALQRGDLNGASARYAEAMRGSGELIRREPDNPERLFDHAQSTFWVGELASRRGDLKSSGTAFREYARLANRMVQLAPGKPEYRAEVQYAAVNLGYIYMKERRYADAARQFSTAVSSIEALAASAPRNTDYQKNLAETLAWLADAQAGQGLIAESIAKRERQVALLIALGQGKRDVDISSRILTARLALGRLLADNGAARAGENQLRQAVALGVALQTTEPANLRWKQRVATARMHLASVLLDAGQTDAAATEVRGGCELIGQLSDKSQGDAEWMVLGSTCLNMRSRVALRQTAPDEALSLGDRALASLRPLRAKDPIEAAYLGAEAHKLIGDAQAAQGDRAGARAEWELALNAFPNGVGEAPRETALRASILNRLGRRAEAARLSAHVRSLGYRRSIS